jgi:hypothetical protein
VKWPKLPGRAESIFLCPRVCGNRQKDAVSGMLPAAGAHFLFAARLIY